METKCPACKVLNAFNPDEAAGEGKKLFCCKCGKQFLVRQKQVTSPVADKQGDKILIAVASAHFRTAVKDFLDSQGFMVVLASDGPEALQVLEAELPLAAIVDVALPGMYGFEICDFIKDKEKLKNTKIILLASIYDKTRYKRMPTSIYGADDYIEMHHIPDALVPKINRLLGREGQRRVKTISADDFESVLVREEMVGMIKDIAARNVNVEMAAGSGMSKAHEEARRLARIIISDIILYNQDAIVQGLKEGNLYELIGDDIKEGQAYYAKRVPLEVRRGTAYLKEAFEQLVGKLKKDRGI